MWLTIVHSALPLLTQALAETLSHLPVPAATPAAGPGTLDTVCGLPVPLYRVLLPVTAAQLAGPSHQRHRCGRVAVPDHPHACAGPAPALHAPAPPGPHLQLEVLGPEWSDGTPLLCCCAAAAALVTVGGGAVVPYGLLCAAT